jgi:hypothetical protein
VINTIEEMLATPGVFVLVYPAGVIAVEVDENLVCHQLILNTLKRDGVLSADGWNTELAFKIIGPFSRKSG